MDLESSTLLLQWERPKEAEVLEGPVAAAVQHHFARGNGPRATRFQLRLRFGDCGAWEPLPPQLLRPEPRREVCDWSLRDGRFARLREVVEVQLRHGNAILWSGWASSSARLGAEAPKATGKPQLEASRRDFALKIIGENMKIHCFYVFFILFPLIFNGFKRFFFKRFSSEL